MHLAIIAAVFPVIFLGELPDKTMFASLVLATRGKPRSVWLGAAGAFVIHVAIATTVGVVLFHVLSHRVIEGVIAATFFVGSMLAFREVRTSKITDDGSEVVEIKALSHRQSALTAFVVVFVAEWGDLTQILTATLAVRYHAPLSVGLGALAALWAVAALAVIGGHGVLRFVSPIAIRKVTAVVLLVLAGFSVWNAVR